MPSATLGDQRWSRSGENSAGDPMYSRSLADSAPSGYEDWTKDELAAELESRGLAKSGTKAELIARLQEDD
jgi:hypothetical protein